MSEIEEILHRAHKKGIYNEVIQEALDLKDQNPELEMQDRYYIAYYRVKKKSKNL